MEDIFTQHLSYAEIFVVRNYAPIDEKEKKRQKDYYDTFKEYSQYNDTIRRRTAVYFPYYIGFPWWNQTTKGSIFKIHYTQNDKHIKRHYGNPFAKIIIHTVERSIRKHENKITIKLYSQIRIRDINCRYFRKSFSVYSVTFNTITGNFTTLEMTKSSKAVNKRIRTNSFIQMDQTLKIILGKYIEAYKGSEKNNFDNDEFRSEIVKTFGFVKHEYEPALSLIPHFMQKFICDKKIKVPDNYGNLIKYLYPTEKYLKKNHRKLILSILDSIGLKSKITNKILHENPLVDIPSLARLCYLFGDDFSKYIGNIKDIGKRFSTSSELYYHRIQIIESKDKVILRDHEKEILIKIYNSTELNQSFIGLFLDHLDMLKTIKEAGIEIEFRADTYEKFNIEHREFSRIINAIRKGWEIFYEFKEETVKIIEEPIRFDYHPVLLKREYDYVEEGQYMHHCVGTYSNHDQSVIISLRTKDGTDRVTSEFDAKSGRCMQSRYFSNATPPDHYNEPLDILKEKVSNLARKGILGSTNKIKVPVIIKGVEIKPKHDEVYEGLNIIDL